MNAGQINRILKTCIGESFLGVFPSDLLPFDKFVHPQVTGGTRKMLVANTDPSDQPGAHWVAFVLDGCHGKYFDSY
ncbi:hypothetical protein, partial [Candidatus Thiosymbion oneisti]|uniref:hypothetical protein n=1 Tax=Candidatus Thiosymbion oneisti TaxID=589554 RepID=UPI001A9C750C